MTAKNNIQSKFEFVKEERYNVIMDGEFKLQVSQDNATFNILSQAHKQIEELYLKKNQEAGTAQEPTFDSRSNNQIKKSDRFQAENALGDYLEEPSNPQAFREEEAELSSLFEETIQALTNQVTRLVLKIAVDEAKIEELHQQVRTLQKKQDKMNVELINLQTRQNFMYNKIQASEPVIAKSRFSTDTLKERSWYIRY